MAEIISKQVKIREIIKCGKNPQYFINKYVKIQHPMRGTVPFETYPFQDDVIDALENHRFNVIVKSRQLGISTVTAAYALWLALFHRDKNVLCIATKLKTAQEFVKKVKVAFNGLPSWLVLKPKVGDSRQHLAWANGSQIKAIPRSEDAGRSEAVSLLIVDEAAHIEGFDELWAALLPTLSTGGSACMLSSPYGASGVFHKTYVDAVEGRNDWNPIELKWDVHPERDEQWFEEQKRLFPERQLRQEYLCDFLGSGDTYISADDIEYLKQMVKAPARRDGPGGKLWIWKDPIPEHKYIIAADVARGDSSGDYSTFHIIDNTEAEVVAEYIDHIRPDQLGKLLDKWGRVYNNALMVPEKNTYGHHTITVLQHRDYPNMYYEQQEKNPNFYPSEDDIPGFNMQGKQKREGVLARMEEAIRNRLIKSYSQRLLNQLVTFVHTNNKAQARKGAHDDLVMSFAIATRVLDVGAIDESARLMAYVLLAATKKSSDPYAGAGGPGNPSGPKSSVYRDAYAVFNRANLEDQRRLEKQKNRKPVAPDAERDHGIGLPEDIRQRLGGLDWLL